MSVDEVRRSMLSDKSEIVAMFDEASSFMLWHTWCDNVEDIRFRAGFAHLGVFFVRASTRKGRLEYWVVVGDVPPLYLDTNDGAVVDPAEALEDYIFVMNLWVEAASGGKVDGPVPPVLTRKTLKPIASTKENALMLSNRLSFLQKRVLPLARKSQ